MELYRLDELVTKDNIHQLADYLDVDIGKLREYMCTDVLVPVSIQERIRAFFNLDGYLVYSPNTALHEMKRCVVAKESIAIADKLSNLILFYRNVVTNGERLERSGYCD